jgi:hypothetical protein
MRRVVLPRTCSSTLPRAHAKVLTVPHGKGIEMRKHALLNLSPCSNTSAFSA